MTRDVSGRGRRRRTECGRCLYPALFFLIAAHVSRSHRVSRAKAVLHSLVCCGVVQADIPRSIVIIGITSVVLIVITFVVIVFVLIVVIIFIIIVFIDIVGTVHRSGIWRRSN